jgi:hypothetical protein
MKLMKPCTYVYLCVCMYICMYVSVFACMCMHACVCVCVCVCVCACVCKCMFGFTVERIQDLTDSQKILLCVADVLFDGKAGKTTLGQFERFYQVHSSPWL